MSIELRKAESQLSEETLRLIAYVDEHGDPGTLLMYSEVELRTGVSMHPDHNGRDRLRRAILRTGREYSVIPTMGYRLAAADSAMGILGGRLRAIDSRVRRADRATRVIQSQLLEELPEPQQKRVNELAAVFAGIRQLARTGNRIFGAVKPRLVLGTSSRIDIPDQDAVA